MATWAVCGASGVLTAASGLHPTANRVSDVLISALFGVGAAAVGSAARTWVWLVLAGIAGTSAGGWAALPSVLALLVALPFSVRSGLRPRRVAGAAVAGLALQSLLRIEGGRFGWSAAISAAAVGLTALSAWRSARGGTRRYVWRGALVLGGVSCGVAASFGLSVLNARNSTEVGIELASEGLAAAIAGDTARAADTLSRAEQAFADAHGQLGGWFAWPARLLPVLGQQARALDLLSGAGQDVAASAAELARGADVQSLTVEQGRLDLDRVTAVGPPLESFAADLRAAVDASVAAASGWLVPPVASRLERFTDAVDAAAVDAETAAQAVLVVPGLFGGDEPRHYFVAFTNPSEARALGGFTGAYAEMVLDDGRISLVRHGNIEQLNDAGRGQRRLVDPDRLPDRLRELLPEQFWQNVSGTSDFPTVAEAVRQLWPQSGGGHLDGVMAVDPYGLAALLQLTGPVSLDGIVEPLSTANAASFLLRDQYTRFGVIDERVDFLAAATSTVFDRLITADLPGPRHVIDVIAPVVRERRMLFHSFHEDEQALFEALGADGSMPPANGGDLVSVRSSNRAANKIDSLLERTLDYSVTIDPTTGAVDATLSVTLHNSAPPSGLPDYIVRNDNGRPFGTNILTLEVTSPLSLVGVTSGGVPTGVAASSEHGNSVYSTLVEVAPETELVVTFDLAGTLDLSGGYRLIVVPQPVVNRDRVHVEVTATEGWRAVSDAADDETVLVEDLEVTATFRPR